MGTLISDLEPPIEVGALDCFYWDGEDCLGGCTYWVGYCFGGSYFGVSDLGYSFYGSAFLSSWTGLGAYPPLASVSISKKSASTSIESPSSAKYF